MSICMILTEFGFVVLFCKLAEASYYSKEALKLKFESNFIQKCSKYPFYKTHLSMLERPSHDYLQYVFHDGTNSGGGLGDRLGGLITAYAFAMRTNRTFYMTAADESFKDSFQPYYPSSNHHANPYSWKELSWTKLSNHPHISSNSTYHDCVNPKPNARRCAMEKNEPIQHIKFRGNRAYLCRWTCHGKHIHVDIEELLATLGVSSEVDLFDVAGCILRLAMWPTDQLWTATADMISQNKQFADSERAYQQRSPSSSSSSSSTSSSFSSQTVSTASIKQIGYHFRCGDTSFNAKPDYINPECIYNESRSWKGTKFSDDFSVESPLDLARCGLAVAVNMTMTNQVEHQAPVTMYVASDYSPSSMQIAETIKWPLTLRFGSACHVDLQSGSSSNMCTFSTSAQWLLLALSDVLVLQGLHEQVESAYSDVSVHQDVKARLAAQGIASSTRELPPISAFSRYAYIYSLSSDGLRYGSKCHSIDTYILSRQTQGNWVCNPKMFF